MFNDYKLSDISEIETPEFLIFESKVESNIDKNLKKISKIPVFKERFSFIRDNLPILKN